MLLPVIAVIPVTIVLQKEDRGSWCKEKVQPRDDERNSTAVKRRWPTVDLNWALSSNIKP